MIDVTAKQMAGQFFKRFAEEIHVRQNPQEAVAASPLGAGPLPRRPKPVRRIWMPLPRPFSGLPPRPQ